MAALFSFRNEIDERWRAYPNLGLPVETINSTSILAGSLQNLLTRQTERGVVLGGGNSEGMWLRAHVPTPRWGAHIPTMEQQYWSRVGVRVIALLGLDLPVFENVPPPSAAPRIRIYGTRWNTGTMSEVDDLLGTLRPWRDVATEGWSGLVNRILPLPSISGEGRNYATYKINISLQTPLPCIGRIWVGNAVEIDKGVDAKWSFSVASAGTLDVSRGGQAFSRTATSLDVVGASLSGNGLDDRLAFGLGVDIPSTGIRRTSDWLSDATRHLGKTGSCILIPRADDDFWVRQTGIYGRLNNQSLRINHRAGKYFEASFEMIQER